MAHSLCIAELVPDNFFFFWLSEYFYFSAVLLVADMLSNAD